MFAISICSHLWREYQSVQLIRILEGLTVLGVIGGIISTKRLIWLAGRQKRQTIIIGGGGGRNNNLGNQLRRVGNQVQRQQNRAINQITRTVNRFQRQQDRTINQAIRNINRNNNNGILGGGILGGGILGGILGWFEIKCCCWEIEINYFDVPKPSSYLVPHYHGSSQ